MKKITFMLFAFLSTLIGFAQTETLTGWSFPTDDGTPLVIEAECGSGNLYADGTNGSSDWTGGVDFFGGHTPAEANQVCGSTTNTQAYSLLNGASGANNGKHLVFKFSTADYEDIVLTYSTRGTANGFDTHTWAYSTDGVAFTDVSTITGTNNTTFSTQTVDFSSNTAINNQSDVYIRLTLSGAGTQNSQNNRLDNIKFVGTEVEAGPPSVGCEIAVTISWEEYADVTNWRLLDVNGDVAIQGGVDWDDEFYDYDSSSTKTHIVANPPYSLEITIDDWMEYCDNNIDYSVTVGGVQDISGTVFVVCDDVITQTFTIGDCPDCSAPANLSASDLTFTSAELSWTGDASLFDIEWGLEGFTQGSGTEVNNISANTHPLTGLTAETSYDFYVRQNCGIDGLSTWAGPYTFYTGYCEVSTTNTTDYISEFSTSGATQNVTYTATSQPAGSYANETAQIIQQAQGLPINFTSTFQGGSNGIKIWVDVNNDFIFDEATEVVFYEASTAETKNGTVTVPVNLPIGEYRVRVRGQYGSSANPLACGNISWGSTIDFTLQVTAAPSCLPVSDLSAITGADSAILSWTSTGALFDIEWGTTGFVQGSGTEINNITDTTHNLNGLTPQTSYDFYVRQNCGTDGFSTWAGPFSFTTSCIATTVPYNQNFDSAVIPGMPSCTSVENAGTGNNWVTYDGSGYGFTGKHLRYSWNSSNDADSWFYTQGIELTAGTVYKVSYDYGGTGTTFPENLKVAYGTSPNHSSMTIVLADHPNVTNSTPLNNEVEFTPTTSGVYYFGFNVYSDADKFYLHLDNIIIDVAATPCVGVVIPTTI